MFIKTKVKSFPFYKYSNLLIIIFIFLVKFSYLKKTHKEKHFTIESDNFNEGDPISDKFTPQGEDINPNIRFSHTPDGTKSYALAVEDPDAPNGTWYHWLVINIPKETKFIKENYKEGTEITNSWGITKYKGPSPPGKELHRYFFKVFALNAEKINVYNIDSFYNEVKKHLISEASIMVKYKKPNHEL